MKIIKIDYAQIPLFMARNFDNFFHFEFLENQIIYKYNDINKIISLQENEEIYNKIMTLLNDAKIEIWELNYVDKHILDGQLFRINIYFEDGTIKEIRCQNKWPKGLKNIREINRICYNL